MSRAVSVIPRLLQQARRSRRRDVREALLEGYHRPVRMATRPRLVVSRKMPPV